MTNTELAILSLIAERARHGYEIEQVIEERGMRDWTEIGFSSIYYILKKLEKQCWLESHVAQDNEQGPARKVYQLTEAGWQAWHEGILDVLSNPRPIYDPFQLGLANLAGLSTAKSLAALRKYHEQLAQKRDYVKARWTALHHAPEHVNAMFDLSMTLLNSELTWLEQFIEQVARKGG
jgi:DNA-binding PadR family transcriptional regulator